MLRLAPECSPSESAHQIAMLLQAKLSYLTLAGRSHLRCHAYLLSQAKPCSVQTSYLYSESSLSTPTPSSSQHRHLLSQAALCDLAGCCSCWSSATLLFPCPEGRQSIGSSAQAVPTALQAIHACAVKFPDVATAVIHLLMDFLGDTNTASALDVVFFVRCSNLLSCAGYQCSWGALP